MSQGTSEKCHFLDVICQGELKLDFDRVCYPYLRICLPELMIDFTLFFFCNLHKLGLTPKGFPSTTAYFTPPPCSFCEMGPMSQDVL